MNCDCIVEPTRVAKISPDGIGYEPAIPTRKVQKMDSNVRTQSDTDYKDTYKWGDGSFPEVDSTDDGKVMAVVDGEWAAGEGGGSSGSSLPTVGTAVVDTDKTVGGFYPVMSVEEAMEGTSEVEHVITPKVLNQVLGGQEEPIAYDRVTVLDVVLPETREMFHTISGSATVGPVRSDDIGYDTPMLVVGDKYRVTFDGYEQIFEAQVHPDYDAGVILGEDYDTWGSLFTSDVDIYHPIYVMQEYYDPSEYGEEGDPCYYLTVTAFDTEDYHRIKIERVTEDIKKIPLTMIDGGSIVFKFNTSGEPVVKNWNYIDYDTWPEINGRTYRDLVYAFNSGSQVYFYVTELGGRGSVYYLARAYDVYGHPFIDVFSCILDSSVFTPVGGFIIPDRSCSLSDLDVLDGVLDFAVHTQGG